MRTATVADIPLLVEMMRRFHKAKEARFPFNASDAATSIARIIESGVVFMTEGGFIAGMKASAMTNARHVTAHEILWWSEDGQGRVLRQAFEDWASDSDDMEISHPHSAETVGAMLHRAGYSPATKVWRK